MCFTVSFYAFLRKGRHAWHCLHRHKRTNKTQNNKKCYYYFRVSKLYACRFLGQVFQQPLETRPAVVATQEGPAWDDDSYMGYSVAVGDFYGEGIQGVAVGMPRGAGLEGKVRLY